VLKPKEINELLSKTPHANVMTMVIYLLNSGGLERFESWYELNPDIHSKLHLALDHYGWFKKGAPLIKWDESAKLFVSRVDYFQKKSDEVQKERNEALEATLKKQVDENIKAKVEKDKDVTDEQV
jgi:hypothetical protein